MYKIAAVSMSVMLMLSASIACAEATPLNTQPGIRLGLSASAYRYEEPDLMSLTGAKAGVDFQGTKAFKNNLFVRADLRCAYGLANYAGSGNSADHSDWYCETRGLAGIDWPLRNSVFSPFLGLGYRNLYNDLRGVTSTGAIGYRRESRYLYLPLGLSHRMPFTASGRLASEIEYDYLLSGTQFSRLSDTGLGYSDLENKQRSGYGLKLNVMYETSIWAAGPYLNYWNIEKSDTGIIYKNGVPSLIGWEPKNITIELGMKINHQF